MFHGVVCGVVSKSGLFRSEWIVIRGGGGWPKIILLDCTIHCFWSSSEKYDDQDGVYGEDMKRNVGEERLLELWQKEVHKSYCHPWDCNDDDNDTIFECVVGGGMGGGVGG